MSVSSSIDLNQLKRLIAQRNIIEKLKIIRVLEKDTYPIRFRQLLKRMKIDDLTFDEITAEVESVRTQRYNAKKKV
ncbi:MAG: hypothetical protein ACE5IR_18570 [bacterium]